MVVALTACAFAAAGDHQTLASIRRQDGGWLRLVISGQATPLTVIAKVFNVLGHEYATLPVRIAIAGLRQRGQAASRPSSSRQAA